MRADAEMNIRMWSDHPPGHEAIDQTYQMEEKQENDSVYQTELDYLVYSITSQGLIDNIEHCCRNHKITGNAA